MIAIFTMACSQLFAHALWIETSPNGKKGQAQEVRVYWGEFADKDISPVDKWFSDTKDFTLTVVSPDGKVTTLTSKPGTDHYKAVFTPDQDGVYTVVMQHKVKDVYHGSRLDYHSSAAVLVGKPAGAAVAGANKNPISVYVAPAASQKINQAVTLQTLLDLKPKDGQEVEVFAPNGWGKKLWTDSTGSASFTPLWPGRYMVEITSTDESKGDHNGKAFEKVWKCATYIVEVAK